MRALPIGVLALACVVSAGTIYVDVANTTGVEDGSAAHPYNTVQEGINAAGNGDEVIVTPGVYVGSANFEGSGITADFTLRSTDPTDPDVVAATVVDNSRGTTCVLRFAGSETPTFVVSGLTFTGGSGYQSGDAAYGGGVYGGAAGTEASITRCVIEGNVAHGEVYARGGGLYNCDGVITHCIIRGNKALAWGTSIQGTIGGGLSDCGGDVVDCLIVDNWTVTLGSGTWVVGGGLACCDGTIAHCTIAYNVGLRAVYDCDGVIRDCIIWGNETLGAGALYSSSTPSYSCIQGWSSGGTGNTNLNPRFVHGPCGFYYVMQTAVGDPLDSPCLDSGSGTAAGYGLATRTTRRDEAGDMGTVDMGYHHPISYPPSYNEVALAQGWNLIGTGCDAPALLADCCVDVSDALLPWDDAVAYGYVQTMLYYYVPGAGYGECRTDGAGGDMYVRPEYGYWLLAYEPGLRLLIPLP